MSERGVFAVDRGIWSDPDFADEAFSEREAFLWIVSEAAWRPTRVRIGSHQVDLARGQCAFSTRFMAQKWKWSEARVRRYLGRLIEAEILRTTTDKIATHITILKYDRFQRVSLPDAEVPTHTRRTDDAPATHPRRKEEDRENTSLRSVEIGKARKHAWPENYWHIVYERYGKKVDPKPSRAALDRLYRDDKVDWTEFIGGIDRHVAAVPDQKFRPALHRFIQKGKWMDEQPAEEPHHGHRPSARITRLAPRDQHRGTLFDTVGAGLARVAARRGIGSGGREISSGSGHAADHGPRRDDPGIEDADWNPAAGHRATG